MLKLTICLRLYRSNADAITPQIEAGGPPLTKTWEYKYDEGVFLLGMRVSSPHEILFDVLLQQTSKEQHQPLLVRTRQHFAGTLACQGKLLKILLVCGTCAGLCQFQLRPD